VCVCVDVQGCLFKIHFLFIVASRLEHDQLLMCVCVDLSL
jgi:hypothetical protein